MLLPIFIVGAIATWVGRMVTDQMVQDKKFTMFMEWAKEHPRFIFETTLDNTLVYVSPLQRKIAKGEFQTGDQTAAQAQEEAVNLAKELLELVSEAQIRQVQLK